MTRRICRSFARALVATIACLGACDAPTSPSPALPVLDVWFRPARLLSDPTAARDAELIGSWNGWARPGLTNWRTLTGEDGITWQTQSVALPPGTYTYAILAGGELLLDEQNADSAYVADPLGTVSGRFTTPVSRVELAPPPLATIVDRSVAGGRITVRARATAPLTARLSRGPEVLDTLPVYRSGEMLTIETPRLEPGKYAIALVDQNGAVVTRASAFVDGTGGTPERALGDGLVYQIMIDRFAGDDGPLAPPETPGHRAGGTLAGIRRQIEAGYFQSLGVTTLWLSPLYQNPDGYFIGRDGKLYTSYHGYWPIAPRDVETRFGGAAALDDLIRVAHAAGLRVIADVVPNHVHEQHPYFRAHSAAQLSTLPDGNLQASWFNETPDEKCICGAPGCDWAGHIVECWFNPFLPDLDWRNPDVADAQVDDLAWWVDRFDLDGVRIDAVPMMPRLATRRIVHRLRNGAFRGGVGNLDFLMLGENFTGAGDGGRDLLRAYLGVELDGLDSQFDFPLMWSLRDALAYGHGELGDIETAFAKSDAAFAGAGATMGHMLDNHDTTRFISEVAGNAAGNPWTAPPAQPTDAKPYRVTAVAMTYLMTLPGLPVIYYGDEVGLAGGEDPDSRRVMPDEATLANEQARLLAHMRRLGRARACAAVLRHGARKVRYNKGDALVLELSAGAARAFVALSRSASPIAVGLDASDGAFRALDAADGALTIAGGHADLVLPPHAAAVYLPSDSPCL